MLARSQARYLLTNTLYKSISLTCTRALVHVDLSSDYRILQGLKLSNYTDIQRSAIPVIQENKHVLIKSPFGSGKTLSYLIPTLEIVRKAIYDEENIERPGFRALILTTSRERAIEIEALVEKIATVWEEPKLTVRAVIGGRNLNKEIDHLDFKEPEIIIATLGRLMDHLPNSDYFRNLKVLVVDNAHHFLNGGEDTAIIEKFLKELAPNRRTVIVADNRVRSESIDPKWLAAEDISCLKTVEVTKSKQKTYKNYVVKTENYKQTIEKLFGFLGQNLHKKVAVFLPTDDFASFLHNQFAANQLYTTLLTTKVAPSIRTASYFFFKSEPNGILLTTSMFEEVMADDIDIIINVGKVMSKDSHDIRAFHLKDSPNSHMITFSQTQLDMNIPDFEQNQEQLTLEGKPMKFNEQDQKFLLHQAYEGLLFVLSKRSDDKEQVFKYAEQLLTDFGTTPEKTSLKFAEKIGMKDVLRARNLLSAVRLRPEVPENVLEKRQTERIVKATEERKQRRAQRKEEAQASEKIREELRKLEHTGAGESSKKKSH
jgi:hypothetical protein